MPVSIGESTKVSGHVRNASRSRAYNHEALEACRDAALQCITPHPLVLVGAPGSGKSLLLHGVSHYVQACHAFAHVVHLSPESVAEGLSKTSIETLTPGAGPAILLVDRLESFEHGTEQVVQLIRAFRNRSHAVLCASTAPPHLLPQLPPGLRQALADARCLTVSPLLIASASAPMLAGFDGAPRLASEVTRLHRVLAALRTEVGNARVVERELRVEVERERALTTALSQAFDTAQKQRRQERRQMYGLHAELVRLQGVIDRQDRADTGAGSREQLPSGDAWTVLESAKLAAMDRARRAVNEVHTLRAENQQLREEAETLLARLWTLTGDLAESQSRSEKLERLRGAYAEQLTEVRERRLAAEDLATAARSRARELESALQQAQTELDALRRARTTAMAAAPKPNQAPKAPTCDARTSILIDTLVSEKAAAELQSSHADARLERTESELIRTRMEMDVLLEENARRLAALGAARERVAVMERAFTQREAEWEQWHAEGARARHAVQRLYEQMRVVLAQRDALQQRLETVEAERNALLAHNARLEAARGASEARAAQAEQDRHAAREALELALAKKAVLRTEVVSLHRAVAQMQKVLDQALSGNGHNGAGNMNPLKARARCPRVGELLVAAGVLREGHLEEALRCQNGNGQRRLGLILIERGFVSEEAVSQAVARQAGVTFVRLSPENVPAQAVRLVSAESARKHACVPLRATARELTVAMADPLDQRARNEIARQSRRRLRVLAAPAKDIREAHQILYAA